MKRRLRFTREGKYYVALTLAIGFAAINTGNNLLFLVLGMLLALIVASGVLSELSLAGLAVRRRPPARVFAAQPVLVGLELTNRKARLPSFAIEVEDQQQGGLPGPRCFFLKVPPGRTQQASYRHTFSRRGLHHLGPLRVSTCYPFGLFSKSRPAGEPGQVVVYPAIHPVPAVDAWGLGQQDEPTARPARRGEFHSLRDFRPGDDWREVHWRKSAQRGRLVVRQNELLGLRQVIIVFDNFQRQEPLQPDDLDLREAAVSEAASIAVHLITRGFAVGLITRTVAIRCAGEQGQLDRLLHDLALLEFITEPRPFPSLPPQRGETRLRVCPGEAVAPAPAVEDSLG
jgi:uncharacterized protein (DUF58 family)